jgi:hypothetical protein
MNLQINPNKMLPLQRKLHDNRFVCMKKSRDSKYTTVVEQKELRAKSCGIIIPDAPPRSDWMTVDECFDDVIVCIEKIYSKH